MGRVRLLLIAVTVACAACNRAPAAGTADGAAVFQSMCATCHGANGHPTEAMIARLNVRDLSSPEFRARVTPALVENQVRKGSQNKLMPSFEGAIDDAAIKAVAAYVASPKFPAPN